MTDNSLPPLPQKIQGIIFTEIIPQLIPEVGLDKLVRLGAIVRKKGLNRKYEPLTDSLRKIQLVKLVGLRAIAIEQEIAGKMEPGALVLDPFGQMEHSLSVTNCLIHTKSALDSMAVFLTALLSLDTSGGERDFKKTKFRQKIVSKDSVLGQKIMELEPWFTQLQNIRDEWIHRSSIRCVLIHGPSQVGVLPIPKNVMLGLRAFSLDLTAENFWSTEEFVKIQYFNLVNLFQAVVERSIQIEESDLKELPPIPADAEKQMTIFPTKLTEGMTVTKMKVLPFRSVWKSEG